MQGRILMSEEDVKFAATQLIDGSQIIKENLNNAAIKEIQNYLDECKQHDIKPNIEEIQNAIIKSKIDFNKNYITNITGLVDKYKNTTINLYPTPSNSVFADFQNLHFFRDAFITIGGNTSSGKTSLVTQMVRDLIIANENALCLFYSLDDGSFFGMRKTIQQFLAYYNEMGHNILQLPKYTDPIHEKYIEGFEKQTNRIFMRDNFEDIETDIATIKLMSGLDNPLLIIALDYLQIIPNETGKENRNFYSESVKYFKEIQQKETGLGGCIFLMLSQLNRSGSNSGNAGLNSYRESSEIENLSDIAINIEYVSKDDTSNTNREINIVKNKIGFKKGYIAEVSDGIITTLSPKSQNKNSTQQNTKQATVATEEYNMFQNNITGIDNFDNSYYDHEGFTFDEGSVFSGDIFENENNFFEVDVAEHQDLRKKLGLDEKVKTKAKKRSKK